jgi:hypothetical protein
MKKSRLPGLALPVLSLLLSLAAPAAMAQTMCVWDPLGAQGDYANMLKDYQLAAKRWGVNLELKVFTDEAKSAEAFQNGECDIANMLGVRTRTYNQFTSTIEAPGAIDNYAQMREVQQVLNTGKAEKYMTNGEFEVVGMFPIGAGYPFVNDRAMNGMKAVVGKRMAVMSWDPVQPLIVKSTGVIPVPMDLTQFGPSFNRGKVDMVIVPMIMYKALELSKGIGSKGGIVHRPALQFTMQLVAHKNKFPEGFGHSSREYMLSQLAFALGVIHNVEAAVEPGQWIYATTSELKDYNKAMRETRTRITAAGYYDKRMLALLKRIRCQTKAADDPDCAPEQD